MISRPHSTASADARRSPAVAAKARAARSQLLRSSVLVSLLQAVSVLVAYVREMAIAHHFGTQSQVDQYYVAFTIVTLIPTLAQTLLWAVFVSTFIRRLTNQDSHVWEFANVTLSYLLLALLSSTAALVCFPHAWIYWLAPGFSPQAVASTAWLLFMLAPVLALMGINVQLMAVLNALKVFGVATLSQTIPSLFSLITVLALGGRDGISSVAWGWTAGSLLQTVLLVWYCRHSGYRYRFQLRPFSSIRELLKVGSAYLLPTLCASIVVLADRYYASMLGPGAIATLNYGDKIFRIPMTVLTTSLFTVSLSYLAESAAGGDLDHFRETASLALRLAAFLLFPAAVFFYICRMPITSLAYQRGAFSPADTRLVAATLVFFAPHVVVHGIWYIVERSMIALNSMRVLILSSLAMVAAKILFSSLLYRPLGAPGIVLSTLICFLVGLTINYAAMIRQIGRASFCADSKAIASVAAAALAAGAVAWLVSEPVIAWLGIALPALHGLAHLLLAGAVGSAAYLLLCGWMNIPEAASFHNWMQRRTNQLRLALSHNS